MGVPRRRRQWDIYRARLSDDRDCLLLIISSDETNAVLDSQVIACEVVAGAAPHLPESPVIIKTRQAETGLEDAATICAAIIASVPLGCLVALEGRLAPVSLRLAVNRGLQILLGNASWP